MSSAMSIERRVLYEIAWFMELEFRLFMSSRLYPNRWIKETGL